MKNPEPKDKLRILFDSHQCDLSGPETQRMRASIGSLESQIEDFPVSDLRVLVEYNGRSNDYSVKTSLILPGETLVVSEHEPLPGTAFDRCIDRLIENVQAYKERMGNKEEYTKQEKGTHQEVAPSTDPDPAELDAAIRERDYTAFRTASFGYEEAVRNRVGRWIERYPDVDARIGHGLEIADIVEEVFLNAFEAYDKRPQDIRFGDWLESLIDPSVKTLQTKDDELENVRLAQAARSAELGADA
jgi:ribosome-associated translation inhibitor RaiA